MLEKKARERLDIIQVRNEFRQIQKEIVEIKSKSIHEG